MNTVAMEVKMQEKLKGPDYQNKMVKRLKSEAFGEEQLAPKKRRKVKEPNSLSCKKKEVKKVEPPVKTSKRKRHKRGKKKCSNICE